MKISHLLTVLSFTLLASSLGTAQTMTFDNGPSEPGFSFSGWNGSGGVIYPASLTVNDVMTIQRSNGDCWNITSFSTAPFGFGGGTWRVFSDQGDELFFNISTSPDVITLNWSNIKWFRLQLDDPGTGGTNNTFDFDNVVYNIPTYVPADTPSLSADVTEVCPGSAVNITVTGSLGTATTWEIYDGGCGINEVQSTNGNLFQVFPSENTTYHVRGIDAGGCTDPGLCGTISISVLEDSTPHTTIEMSPEIGCFPQEVTLTASGGINGTAAVTQWFTGPNGTGIQIGIGTSITYTATGPTTVYARRAGQCNVSDDLSFDITSTLTCIEDYGDICSATVISASDCSAPVIINGDNTGFAPSPSSSGSCHFGNDPSQNSQWFSLVVPAGGALDIETFNTGGNTDTQILVYTSSDNTCAGTLTEIACGEDIDASNSDYMTFVELTGLTEGSTIFIEVDGYSGIQGSYDMTVTYCLGCTSPEACNYNPNANADDGSCEFGQWYLPVDFNSSLSEPVIFSCSTPPGYELAQDQNCVELVANSDPYCVNTDWDAACQAALIDCSIPGCTDQPACNYNISATYDDDSCFYPEWYLPIDFTSSGEEPAVLSCTAPAGYVLAEDQNCLQQIVDIDDYCVLTDWDQICQDAYDACINPIPGCTDSFACNYNIDANIEDGSCVYPVQYPADFTDDLVVTAADLTGLLTIFGSSCAAPQTCGCKGDFNSDGVITAADLTGFLTEFGSDYNP